MVQLNATAPRAARARWVSPRSKRISTTANARVTGSVTSESRVQSCPSHGFTHMMGFALFTAASSAPGRPEFWLPPGLEIESGPGGTRWRAPPPLPGLRARGRLGAMDSPAAASHQFKSGSDCRRIILGNPGVPSGRPYTSARAPAAPRNAGRAVHASDQPRQAGRGPPGGGRTGPLSSGLSRWGVIASECHAG